MLTLHYGLFSDTTAHLQKKGFRVIVPDSPIESAEDLRAYATYFEPDLIILDLCKGAWVIEEVKALRSLLDGTSIIGIYGGPAVPAGDDHDWWCDTQRELLAAGVTVVLRGPVDNDLIVEQAFTLFRASKRIGSATRKFVVGDSVLEFDFETLIAKTSGKRIDLKPQNAALLGILLENAGRVRTKDNLMQGLYFDRPVDEWPELKIIDVLVCQLRAILRVADPVLPALIETVWGRGYLVAKPMDEKSNVVRPAFCQKVA